MSHLGFFNYFHIGPSQANSTFTLGGQGARLFAVTVNTQMTGGTITLSDGSGGSTIAIISGSAPGTYFYLAVVSNNIFVTVGALAAGDATITYS